MQAHRRHDAETLVETLRLVPRLPARELQSRWSSSHTQSLIHLARREGAGMWLYRRLSTLGVEIDAAAREVLVGVVKQATAQCLRVDAELARTLALLDEAGIECIPLKGAALRTISDRVPYADARGVSDVDLLCRVDDARRAFDALVRAGYETPKRAPLDGHHLPVLVGHHGVGVDLHITTVAAVPPNEAWRRATTDAQRTIVGETSRRIPSDTELVWHSLAHSLATVHEVAYASLRARHWLDAAAMIAAGCDIDWDVIAHRLTGDECEFPELGRAWLRTAYELSGRADHPVRLYSRGLDINRLLAWRLELVTTPPTRWAEKLLEEGTRGEAGLPYEAIAEERHVLRRARHLLAARAARSFWALRAGARSA